MLFAKDSDIDSLEIISGFITGILIDFTGAIFIVMYNKTIDSTISLSGLINDNRRANFSHYIASKITDEKIKDETLAKMAVSIFNTSKKGDESEK